MVHKRRDKKVNADNNPLIIPHHKLTTEEIHQKIEELAKNLTERQLKFSENYVRDGILTKAYSDAGYSENPHRY